MAADESSAAVAPSSEGIPLPHQSVVTAIECAARQGLFTAAEAAMLIDRLREHVTTSLPPGADPV